MSEFLDPAKILKQLKLKDDITAADFGSGSGGWVISLAKELEGSRIYALDILEEPLSALKAKAKLAKISNIETILADVEKETGIIKESCDLVLMTNLLFQCQDKRKVFAEAKRVLKKNGKVLVVDWKKDNPLTKEIEQVSIEEIREIAKELGFKLKKEFEAGPYHFGLVFTLSKKKVNIG